MYMPLVIGGVPLSDGKGVGNELFFDKFSDPFRDLRAVDFRRVGEGPVETIFFVSGHRDRRSRFGAVLVPPGPNGPKVRILFTRGGGWVVHEMRRSDKSVAPPYEKRVTVMYRRFHSPLTKSDGVQERFRAETCETSASG